MDVVSVLFLWGLLQFREDNGRVGVYGVGAYNPMYLSDETFIAYTKNVRACSINVVMVMV